MKKKMPLLLYFILIAILPTAIGQKKIIIDFAANANLSFSNNVTKVSTSTGIPSVIAISYNSRLRNTNPFFYVLCNPKYPVSKKLAIGIQTGLQFHFSEISLVGITRTFVAVPLQATMDYKMPFSKKGRMGVSIGAGGVLYKIDDGLAKINNALLFNLSPFYEISKRRRISVGMEKQIDNASLHFNISNPNLNEYSGIR